MRVERTRQAAAVDPSASPAESASALLTQLFPHQKLSEAEQRDALQHLQRRHGLEPNGKPSPQTLDALRREVRWLAHERAASEPELSPSTSPGKPGRFDPHRARVESQLRRPTLQRSLPAEARRILTSERALLQTLSPRMRALPRAVRAAVIQYLTALPRTERPGEQRLLERVLTGPNAERVVGMLRTMPAGVPQDVRRAVIHGVGIPRGIGREGAEGVLGTEHADLVLRTLEGLRASDRRRVQELLDQVGSQAPRTERSLLLKAVAARWQRFRGSGAAAAMSELRAFARSIRGHERAGLVRATSAVVMTADGYGVMQMHPSACTQVAAMIVRAEADPVFAWELTATLDTLGPRANDSSEADAEATQRELANGRYGVGLLSVPLELMGSEPNRGYIRRAADEPSSGYMRSRMVHLAASGVDVPIGVQTLVGGHGHAMVITDARGMGDDAVLKISDPSGGLSRWVRVDQLDDFRCGAGRVRLRAWMDSARATRETVTTDERGVPRATRDLFDPV